MLRHSRAIGAITALVGLGLACASPTLPLPPPELPTLEPSSDVDHVRLIAGCGGAESNAVIVIINENTAVAGDLAVSGSIANNCGAWDATVYAHRGDVLSMTQEVGNLRSLAAIVTVR